MGMIAKAIIRAIIEALYIKLWDIYEDMIYDDYMLWDEHIMQMNPGQRELRYWYVQPELASLMEGDWFFFWPPDDPEEYTWRAYGSHWAVEQALNRLVERGQEKVSNHVEAAQQIYAIIQFLESILPFA